MGSTDTRRYDRVPAASPPSPWTRGSFVAAVLAAGSLLVWALLGGSRLWFFSDDWNILTEYPQGNLLEPFNGHLSLLPAGVYQALFNTVGTGSYLPYRLVGLAALGVLAFQVARFAGERAGGWVSVLAVGAVVWNSSGATNVMFPFLMNFSLPVAALVAIWWHLDRDSSRDDVAAGLWLAVALASSGLGVVALAAVTVELVARRAPLWRWAAFAPASVLWGLWWLANRSANDIGTDPTEVVPYALRMAWAGTTALAAGWAPGGLALGALLVVLLVCSARLWHTLDARVLGALTAPLAFVGLTALTRADTVPPIPPDELRYGWTVAAYLVLIVVVALPRPLCRRLPGAPLARGAAVLVALVVVAGGVRLAADARDWVDQVADAAPGLRANLYAAEAAGTRRVDPDVVMPVSFVPVTAGAYVAAVELVGSPLSGATAAEIGGRADQRTAADDLLFRSVAPVLLSGGTAPGSPAACTGAVEAPPGALLTVVVPAGRPAAAVAVSRFAQEPGLLLEPDGEGLHRLQLPADAPLPTRAVVPYRVEGVGGALVCPSPS